MSTGRGEMHIVASVTQSLQPDGSQPYFYFLDNQVPLLGPGPLVQAFQCPSLPMLPLVK